MQDIRQIKLISDSLNKEKDKYMYELSKINSNIVSKISMIDKMIKYQNDYMHETNLNMSKAIPGLHININLFIKKIDVVIEQARMDLNNLETIRKSVLEKIDNLNKKIDLMSVFETKSKAALRIKEDKNEQTMLDDIAATMDKRREYE